MSNISNLVKFSDLNKKLSTLPTKSELKVVQVKIVTLQSYDTNYFRGKSQYKDDGIQNY